MPGEFEFELIARAQSEAYKYLENAENTPFGSYLDYMNSMGYGPELAKQMFWDLGCSVRWDMSIDLSSLLVRR